MSGPLSLPRAVLWDMDGTLADSRDCHWRAWRDAMKAAGRTLTPEQFADAFGQRNDRFLRAWLGTELSDEAVTRFGEEKEAAYRRLVETDGLVPLPGAVAWVTRLRRDGWRQAVASSAPASNVVVMARALGLLALFDAFAAAEDVQEGKPDPRIFLVAAARLGVPPARCIVVEDASVGTEAARRAGMRSIGVNGTVHLDADLSVRFLTDLPEDAFDRLLADRLTFPFRDR